MVDTKLNKNEKLLVEALESGSYSQAIGTLREYRKGKKTRYCCLGVACQVYKRETGKGFWDGKYFVIPSKGSTELDYANGDDPGADVSDGNLPSAVQEWLGWGSPDGDLKKLIAIDGVNALDLVSLNDAAEFSFRQIAAEIRKGNIRKE